MSDMSETRELSWQEVAVGNPLSYGTLPEDLSQLTEQSSQPLGAAPLIDDLRAAGLHAPGTRAGGRGRSQRDNPREPQYAPHPAGNDTKRIAVLISHGMGQQVPFETLHAVAEGIWREHTGAKLRVDDLRVRYVTFGRNWRPRVEMTLSDAPPDSQEQAKTTREIHLYEAYWAPLTEDETNIREVFAFLLGAAKRGIKHGVRGFGRYMFGKFQRCNLSPAGALFLNLTRSMLWILAIAFVGFWAATATQWAAAVHAPGWRSWAAPLLWALTLSTGGVFLTAGLFTAAASFIAGRSAARGNARRGALATGVVLSLAAGVLGFATHWFAWRVPVRRLVLDGWTMWIALVVLALVALAIDSLRKLVVQYVGDVAIYVSAHTVSRFAKIREGIQSIGRSLARDVYGAYDLATKAVVYDEVVVVGHSLGSVVAYDMLNDSIQRDLELANRLRKWSNVIGRTKLLLTAGSPLDKTAFLFRTQADSLATREALAAAAQPMIRDYGLRPANWVNIWSPWDWISGSLQYYDDLTLDPPDARAVINKVDPDAPLFVAPAHTGYWQRPLMRGQLYKAVWA